MKSPRAWALVGGVALAASATSLTNGFVYDDVPVAQEDVRLRTLDVPRLLTMPYWGDAFHDRIYRPLTSLSFAVDWALGGGSPVPFHATNLVLHLLVTLLVFALARRLLDDHAGALVAGLWFAVHPVHVEPVAGVVGRAELLAAFGYLGAVLTFRASMDATGRERAGLLALVGLGAAVAYGGKEHGLTLPALLAALAVLDALRRGDPPLPALRRALPAIGVTIVLAAGFLAARSGVVGTATGGGTVAAGLEGLGAVGRASVMLPAVLVWGRLLLFPLHLQADYAPNAFEPLVAPGVRHVAALVLLAAAVWVAWRARRRAPGVTIGLAWFAVTASVAANVVVPTGVLIAERVLYLPSAGAALALGAAWSLLPPRAWRWPATALVLSLLAARSLARVPAWRSNDVFFAQLVRDAPASYRSHWMLGTWAFRHGERAQGERELLAAIRIFPADPGLVAELGMKYLEYGRFDDADRFLSAALRGDSMMGEAASRAIIARLRAGRADSAAALARRIGPRFREQPEVQVAAFTALIAAGAPAEAQALAAALAQREPGTWQYQQLTADAALQAGDCTTARERLERAAALAPLEEGPRALAARLDTTTACRRRR